MIYPVILLLTIAALVCESRMNLTLTSTNGMNHVCPNVTLVATCSGGIGRELEWNLNGIQFLFDNNSAELPDARTLNNALGIPVTTYMINRIIFNETNVTYQYTSQLSIARVTFDSARIACIVRLDPIDTMNVETDHLFIQTSVSPNASSLQSGCVIMSQDRKSTLYQLEWTPPDNIMDFDLAHYEVKITTPSMNTILLCVNTTAIVSFDGDLTAAHEAVHVSIVAITQCGQRGVPMERAVQLETCQSSKSSAINPKSSFIFLLWAMLMIAGMVLHQ